MSVDDVDLEQKKLTAMLFQVGEPVDAPKPFDLLGRTVVYKEHEFGTLKSIQKDQFVQFNLTWVGLFQQFPVRADVPTYWCREWQGCHLK